MRPGWRGNQGPGCTGLCKLGEKFGFYLSAVQSHRRLLSWSMCCIFKKPLWLLQGEWLVGSPEMKLRDMLGGYCAIWVKDDGGGFSKMKRNGWICHMIIWWQS